MAKRKKTSRLALNGQGKFDAIDEDGEITFPNIANWLEVERIISSLEGNGEDIVQLKTFEEENTRTFSVKASSLASEAEMRTALIENQYYMSANFSRYLLNYLMYGLQSAQKAKMVEFRHSSLGFYEYNHEKLFLTGSTQTANGISYYASNQINFQNGNSEAFTKFLEEEILIHKSTQLALVLGLSSVTASYLKDYADSQTLVVNLCGPSSTGKTTIAQFMGSLWGNPKISNSGIVKTFSNTERARFNVIEGYNGFPMIFDDLTAGYQVNRSRLVYELSQGEARQRSSNYGKSTTQGKSWSGVAIITSETPLLTDSENRQGLIARVIDTDNIKWTEDSEHSKRIKQTIQQVYGHVGPQFVKKFLNLDESTIKKIYDKVHSSMDKAIEKRDNLTDRILNKLAIIQTTATLVVQELGFDLNLEYIQKKLISFEENGIEDRHIALKALEIVKIYIQQYHNKFDKWIKNTVQTQSAHSELNGVLQYFDEELHVFIPSKIVKDILQKSKIFEYDTILKYWGEKGIIKTQSGRHTVNSRKLDSRAVRFVFEKHEDSMLPWYKDPEKSSDLYTSQEPPQFKPNWKEPTAEEIFEELDMEDEKNED